ncbi:hypothetical protein JOC73_001497 [Alkaliphilus hydrothermalis]|uniref:Uncharacterized protein n=1 Tax=Alkaliphilus hydrothermalis TaxID=1482730 RepID=A0ABS2NPS3_9FIRM|nr:hypothetical protein [Alkaliphilus hydrothermalis]
MIGVYGSMGFNENCLNSSWMGKIKYYTMRGARMEFLITEIAKTELKKRYEGDYLRISPKTKT